MAFANLGTQRTIVNTMDPLGQTFTVDEAGGIFLTRVGLKFATKSSTEAVRVEIRPTVNGVPSTDVILPGGIKQLSASAVQTPDMPNRADGAPPIALSAATPADLPTTWFELDEPVYLNQSGTYAFVVTADTAEYNVYVATTGGFYLNSTERRIMKQPAAGTLFRASNGLVWEPDLQRDMAFILEKAVFSQTSGTLRLVNADIPNEALTYPRFSTTNGNSNVYVMLKGHGFTVNDLVNIQGSENFAGFDSAGQINGIRTITSVDGFGFTFGAGGTPTASSIGGGVNANIERQHMADIVVPSIQSIVPAGTLLSYNGRFTSGKSLAGTETPYQVDGDFIPLKISSNNVFSSPKLVASARNEEANLAAGSKSVNINANLSTVNQNISPVIDLQRASLLSINNFVDYQQSPDSNYSNRNIPHSYVPDTEFRGGTSLANHITAPVLLETDATGLKAFASINRPSVSGVDMYYRTNRSDDSADGTLLTSNWILTAPISSVAPDDVPSVFREYEYLIGGDDGSLLSFNEFQFKIVMKSSSSSKVPVIRDFRVIALGT
jgi:hypothetical protein